MEIHNIHDTPEIAGHCAEIPRSLKGVRDDFESYLDEEFAGPDSYEPVASPAFTLLPPDITFENIPNILSGEEVRPACEKEMRYNAQMSDWQKYKDDQLLSNPGGDGYYLKEGKVISDPEDQESFWGRIGKDLSDSFDNLKNSFKDLFFGSEILYRDENNQIREAAQPGVVGSVVEFFKDLGSALSFGTWRPDGEVEPAGFVKRIGFFFSKMKESIFGDLVQGVGGSAIRVGEGLVLAGWNLAEVIPDATIGNFEEGRKLTTTIFDNGQVAIDYLTDIFPTGEAWLRVHSPNFDNLNDAKAPIIYNIGMPEHYMKDIRWKYVRNTPFRKTIETIGSLLADVVAIQYFGDTGGFSHGRKE